MPVDYGRAFEEAQLAQQQEAARLAEEQRQRDEQDRVAGVQMAQKFLNEFVRQKTTRFSGGNRHTEFWRACEMEMNRQLRPSGLHFAYHGGSESDWYVIEKIPPSAQPKKKNKLPTVVMISMVFGLVSLTLLLLLQLTTPGLFYTGGGPVVTVFLVMSLILGLLAFILGITGLIKCKNKVYSAIGALSGLAPWVILISNM